MNRLKEERLTAKNDIIFKELFSKKGNEDLLENLLESILNIKVKCKSITKEARIGQLRPDEKYGSLDIRILLKNNVEVDLEMQIVDKKDTYERALYYASVLTVEGLRPTDDYSKMTPKIIIFLLDYELYELDEAVINTKTCIEGHNDMKIKQLQKCYFVNLNKINVVKNNDNLKRWLLFFNNNKKELTEMGKNKIIEKAEEELKYLTGNDEIKRLAWLRQKALRDEIRMKYLLEEAEKEKMEAEKEKMKVEKTIHDMTNNIVRKLLEKGFDKDNISEITGLSQNEIEKIIK